MVIYGLKDVCIKIVLENCFEMFFLWEWVQSVEWNLKEDCESLFL